APPATGLRGIQKLPHSLAASSVHRDGDDHAAVAAAQVEGDPSARHGHDRRAARTGRKRMGLLAEPLPAGLVRALTWAHPSAQAWRAEPGTCEPGPRSQSWAPRKTASPAHTRGQYERALRRV